VWIAGSDGKPVGVRVQVGITDGQSSEVVGEALTEGQRVIIGTGNAEQSGSPGGSPRLRL
jgi:hypothetical protein